MAEVSPELVAVFTGSINKIRHYNSSYNKAIAFIGLQWEILDGFANINNIIEARAKAMMAKHKLQETKLDVAANIWGQYNKFKSAHRQLKAANEYEKAAKEAFDSAHIAYGNGLVSFIDLMTAQNALATARQKLVGAKNNLSISLATLAYATGDITITK